MMKRTCFMCKQTLPLEAFCKDKTHYLGVSHRCKSCDRKRVRGNYDPIYERKKTIKRTASGRALATSKKMLKLYPEKWRARWKLRYAVKVGKIIKPEQCEEWEQGNCSSDQIQAHHWNGYEGDNWKLVWWLCRGHHMFLHRKDS